MINNINRPITLVTAPPLVTMTAEMRIIPKGMNRMMEHIRSRYPECLTSEQASWRDLVPHTDDVSDNELIAELAGRSCYMSFGNKAGQKTNREYIANTQKGKHPHVSIVYHPKIGGYFGGISNRMARELIRNYVGADRTEEGNPSEMSTRFTEHNGFIVVPPHIIGDDQEMLEFKADMQAAYTAYLSYIKRKSDKYEAKFKTAPKHLARKRIYEAAANRLPTAAETAFWWTSNPVALAKMVSERGAQEADSEFRRFAEELRVELLQLAPNLFQQPFMQVPIDHLDDKKTEDAIAAITSGE